MPELRNTHTAEKARDITVNHENASQHVDNKKYDVRYTRLSPNKTCDLLTALCS